MVRMFIRHAVNDFDTWKQTYDQFDEEQKQMGVIDDGVYQAVDDPNDVTVWHDFRDVDTARSMANSDRLAEAMEEAGVAEEPTIWFTEPA